MNTSREILKGQLDKYEEQLKSLNSYIKELKDRTAECGTDKEQFEEALFEAEQNAHYYEDEVSRVKKEMRGFSKAKGTGKAAEETGKEDDTVLPLTVKQGVGALIVSSISFLAGALLGMKLKDRRGSKD